jgi:diphthine methyl ester acylhydrolase
MYELNEEESTRKGAIAICDENQILSQIDETAGILDMKFSKNLLACALSSGDLSLYEYDHENITLKQLHHTALTNNYSGQAPDEGLALSLCWNSQRTAIGVSSEKSSLLFYTLTPTGLQLTTLIPSAHLFHNEPVPAWIITSSPHQPDLFLSGGDDCCMKLWDLKQNSSLPIFISSSKHFQAGVTSAQWHPSLEHIFAVGSYDQTVKIWDQRSCRQPLCEMDTGGGVWRIKWAIATPTSQQHFLAIASMQGGSGVYCWDQSSLHRINQQMDSNPNRLVYGIDWLSFHDPAAHMTTGSGAEGGGWEGEREADAAVQWKIATCSFYDNLVQTWDSGHLSR